MNNRPISQADLRVILAEHHAWLLHKGKGKRAVLRNCDFRGLNLQYHNLSGADVQGSNFEGVNLFNTDLSHADISHAKFGKAKLQFANLLHTTAVGTDFQEADLWGVSLNYANVSNATFIDTELTHVTWKGTSLYETTFGDNANLTPFKEDLFTLLCYAPLEAERFIALLNDGLVGGATNWGLGRDRIQYYSLWQVLQLHESDDFKDNARPIVRWLVAISLGDTPANSPFARKVVEWIREWQRRPQPLFVAHANNALVTA